MSNWDFAQAALLENDLEKALPLLRNSVQEAQDLPEGSEEKVERLNLLATALARQGEVAQAEILFAQSLKERIESAGLDPIVATTLYLMGEMYRHDPVRMLDAAGVLAVASEILERHGIESELTFQVEYACAVVSSRLMDPAGALKHLGKAWPLIPPGSPVLFNMLSLAASLGMGAREYEFAAQVFQKTASLHPPGPQQLEALGSLADLQLLQGQFSEALETTSQGLNQSPDDAKLLRRHGVAASRLGRSEEASESLLRARNVARFRNDQAELTLMLGDIEARQQRWEKAVERYVEALALVKADRRLRAHIRVALGLVYLKLGEQEQARLQFVAASGLRKRLKRPPYALVAEALLHLGHIYQARGKFFRAELRLLAALEMLDADNTPFEVLHPSEQEKVTELLAALPLALSTAIESQQRWAQAASVLEPLVIHCAGPLEEMDRLASLYQRAEIPDRADFWTKVAHEMRNPEAESES